MSISPVTFWLIFALILAGGEIVSTTFYLLAIALGALIGALAAWLGASIGVQCALVALVSLAITVSLKIWKKKKLSTETIAPSFDIGQRVTIVTWKNERLARVSYRGSQWDAELAPEAQSGQDEYVINGVKANTLILNSINTEKA